VSRFSPAVERQQVGARVVLWHQETGRHVALDLDTVEALEACLPGLPLPPQLRGVAARLDRLGLLAESSPPARAELVPARSRLVLLLPDEPALWLPMPAVRTPGGHAYALRPLSPAERAVWQHCNGARTTAEVAARAGVPLAEALAFLGELTRIEVQAIQLREGPVRSRDLSLERLVAPERPPAPRPAHLRGASGETTLDHYHLHEIVDGDTHFDDRETTVAHAFHPPHPAFGGEPYGARLHRVLEERGLLGGPDTTTLEIGPGDGELGEAFLARARATGLPGGEHVRLDRAPELLRTQRRRQPGTREVLGTATDLPFADASLDLVLCNEVIADLSAVPYDPRDPEPSAAARAVAARLERYGIPPLPAQGRPPLYNLGAWLLVEELGRTLRPGGVAWLSEFGGLDEAPQETVQLDHPEVSIHFGHLRQVAQGVGLEARVEGLADFLRVDLNATWLARHSHEALRALLSRQGGRLAARAWTPESLELPFAVEGLQWVPVSEPGPGPVVLRFQCVVLRR
jgi:SAM-dependent methyltransferase